MRAAVAAGHAVTAQAAARVLEQGGNAVDAVVAAGAMSWAAEPGLTGPCGGGFLMVRPARTRRVHVLDAFTAIPGQETPPDRKLTEVVRVLVPFDEQTTQVFHIGAAACAVPGALAGLHAVHRRFGSMPWADLLRPAAEAATRGVASSGGQYAVLVAIRDIVRHTPEASEVFWPRGELVAEGEPIRQPDLTETIERLAERPDDLYTGELARAMVAHQHATAGPGTHAAGVRRDHARRRPHAHRAVHPAPLPRRPRAPHALGRGGGRRTGGRHLGARRRAVAGRGRSRRPRDDPRVGRRPGGQRVRVHRVER